MWRLAAPNAEPIAILWHKRWPTIARKATPIHPDRLSAPQPVLRLLWWIYYWQASGQYGCGFKLCAIAFLKLERTLDACASVYAAFCKRYQSKAKPNPRSRWGVWQLWREVNKSTKSTKRASAQADLFAQSSARYHGGSQNQALEQTVGILRPAVMAQVSKFLRVSQEV